MDASCPGLDLLGRDTLLLGRLLATLAAFSEHASGTAVALPLANATLELLSSCQVHSNADVYVRRAALLAAGQVVASLMPQHVATALLSGRGEVDQSRGHHLARRGGGGRSSAVGDERLLQRLDWVQGWVREAAAGDVDETCRMMAEACVNIQAGVAAKALETITEVHQQGASFGDIRIGGITASVDFPSVRMPDLPLMTVVKQSRIR